MNRRYIDTGQTITRGTAFPLVLTLPLDLTDYVPRNESNNSSIIRWGEGEN